MRFKKTIDLDINLPNLELIDRLVAESVPSVEALRMMRVAVDAFLDDIRRTAQVDHDSAAVMLAAARRLGTKLHNYILPNKD